MSSNNNTRTRARRVAITSAAVLGGAVLALAVPTMAAAHVGVSPDELVAA